MTAAVVFELVFVVEVEVPVLLPLIWLGTLLPPGMSGMWWCDAPPSGDDDDDEDDEANVTGVLPLE